jgi:hypothetical protein
LRMAGTGMRPSHVSKFNKMLNVKSRGMNYR